MTPEKVITRYLKVQELAKRGSPGERDNAKAVARSMERNHPGLKKDVAAFQKRKEGEKRAQAGPPPPPPSSPPPGVWPQEGYGFDPSTHDPRPEDGPTGNWENIFGYARAAWQQAYGFAQAAANVMAGRNLASEYVSLKSRESRNGQRIFIQYSMPREVYEAAFGLNPLQQRAFRETLHEMLSYELDELFADDGEEGEDYDPAA